MPPLRCGYQTDEAFQPPARKCPSGWRLIRRAVGRYVKYADGKENTMNEAQVRQIFDKLSSLDKDEREKVHQALISVGLFVIPHILCAMLSEGLVDPDRAHNRDYLWSLLVTAQPDGTAQG